MFSWIWDKRPLTNRDVWKLETSRGQHGRKRFWSPSMSWESRCRKEGKKGCLPLGSPLSGPLLTWSPPHWPLAAAAEAYFAEHPENMPLAQGAPVFAGAGAALGGRHPVAVGLPRLPLLPDQGAGYRCSHSCSARPQAQAPLRPRDRAPRGEGRTSAADRKGADAGRQC